MNWTDLLVIAVLAGFAFIGFKKGFIYSVFKLLSFFISIFLSIKLYPVLATLLKKALYSTGLSHQF